ncbi:MAG: hypothetical protein MUD16_13605 [Desulfobacterales bacterium]|nr:hypothetical protein [Desulfobacterales bacterium]
MFAATTKIQPWKWILIAFVFTAGFMLRVHWILPPGSLDADGAAFGLMALRIHNGLEFPIFLWGAHYSGTLVSYIGALMFGLLWVSPHVFMLSGLLLAVLWVALTWALLRGIAFKTRILIWCMVLVPPATVLTYSQFSGGIHAENLVCGSLLLLIAVKWADQRRRRPLHHLALAGVACGFGLWLSPGVLPAVLTLLVVFLTDDREMFYASSILLFAVGFAVGFLPAVYYNIENPCATLFRFGARMLDLDRQVLTNPDFFGVLGQRVVWRLSSIPTSLGTIPQSLAELLGGANLAFFGLVLLLSFKTDPHIFSRNLSPAAIFRIYIICFAAFYSIFVGQPQSRYMLPLYIVAAPLTGDVFLKIGHTPRRVLTAALALLVLFNTADALQQSNSRQASELPQLKAFLESEGMDRGFSDLDTAYNLILRSREELIISPTLYHPSFYDRWPEYTRAVRSAERPVVIIDTGRFREAASVIEDRFAAIGVSFRKTAVGRFVVYHDPSRRVAPEHLRLPGGSLGWEPEVFPFASAAPEHPCGRLRTTKR